MAVKPIPEGYHTVVPYIVAADAEALLEFLKTGLKATEHEVMRYPDGKVWHGDVVMGDSHVMLSQATEQHPAMPATLYRYVAILRGLPSCTGGRRYVGNGTGHSVLRRPERRREGFRRQHVVLRHPRRRRCSRGDRSKAGRGSGEATTAAMIRFYGPMSARE